VLKGFPARGRKKKKGGGVYFHFYHSMLDILPRRLFPWATHSVDERSLGNDPRGKVARGDLFSPSVLFQSDSSFSPLF
jgi:hypothetical protein